MPRTTGPPAPIRPSSCCVTRRASIVATNQSPDIGFDASVNPYRGCAHACTYCYARPTHEYLGLSAGRDFETKILVKENAPELLRKKLNAPSWKPQVLAFFRRDGLLPAGRAPARDHAPLPRGPRGLPEPRADRHEELARGPGRGPARRAGRP